VTGVLRIGIQLPQWGAIATRDSLIRLAREAESAGLDSVWISDHVVYPVGVPADYPYSPTKEPPFAPEDGYLEALATLAVIAGATERIRLATSVLILPMRPLLLTAKTLATIDVMSGGRLDLAVADGWWRAEFEALGADFDVRRDVLDEQIVAMRKLWTVGRGSANGPHLRFGEVVVEPRPIQPGGPTLWVGGRGPRTWRRVASHDVTGWHGIGYDSEQIGRARDEIIEACALTGREPDDVSYSTATGLPRTADRTRERLDSLVGAGIDQVVLIPRSDTLPAALDEIAMLADIVGEYAP
jgi:probable F420-dependent oxidoreductase